MSRKRLGRLQRVATIIPLALLSAAWTASVAGIGSVSSPVVANEGPAQLTDGTSVPEESIDDPASLSDPASVEGLNGGNEAGIVSAASTNAIPAAALAAYQRAETVINSADKSCNITWQLIAAIGRVESNHGRFGGNVLNDDGVATPGIYGLPLNGKKNTQAISDTDAGVYDNDAKWDRAVGPMQFIPSTWQVVGVDADDDASRNPQDIDDSALAAAVYLCSGEGDLSTVVGQRAAVYRYNHSQSYVDLVLKIMNAYIAGDFTSVPNNSTAAGYIVPEPPSFGVDGPKNIKPGKNGSKGGGKGSTGGGTDTPGSGTP
ncbi:MAG TPA: lytic transglycosylase domain-containing protein, partial [Acidimicrobiales bacterium]